MRDQARPEITKVNVMTSDQLGQLSINTIRRLAIDEGQQAGHPTTPLAFALLGFHPERIVAAAKELLGKAVTR
jgi:hypothetical protein